MNQSKTICMVVQNPMVKGGIAAVINGYRGSQLEKDFNIIYVESYRDGGKLIKIFKALVGYFHFAKVLIVDKPDIVHIQSSFGPSFYRKIPFIYLASWAKKPIINHIHGAEFESFYTNANEKKKTKIRKVYNKCDVLIALSNEWKEKLSVIVRSEKIKVIENYSIIHEDTLKERLGRKSNNQVLFLGEIGRRKGCYDIPAVVAKVEKAVPNVKFVIAGTGEIEQIQCLLKERNVESHVIFPGWVRNANKDELLRECDVFFLPSYNEGMPMAILDAMGYGLPVISTIVGGIPKIVHDGENGYLFEAGDVDGFSAGIIQLLENQRLHNQYCIASHEIVKNRYSLEYHLSLLETLYKKMSKAR